MNEPSVIVDTDSNSEPGKGLSTTQHARLFGLFDRFINQHEEFSNEQSEGIED